MKFERRIGHYIGCGILVIFALLVSIGVVKLGLYFLKLIHGG